MKVCGPEPILLPLHPLSSLRWRPPQMLPVKNTFSLFSSVLSWGSLLQGNKILVLLIMASLSCCWGMFLTCTTERWGLPFNWPSLLEQCLYLEHNTQNTGVPITLAWLMRGSSMLGEARSKDLRILPPSTKYSAPEVTEEKYAIIPYLQLLTQKFWGRKRGREKQAIK